MLSDAAQLGFNLDELIWPAIRAQLIPMLQERIHVELSTAREALLTDHAQREANLQAREHALLTAAQELQENQEAYVANSNALEEEKQRMAIGTHTSDVLNLNIGGEKTISVSRGTLGVVEESMLASSFSGRWDNSLPRDGRGAFFIDFDPELFVPLLTYLRMKRIQDPNAPAVMPTVPGREAEFDAMVRYFGVRELTAAERLPFRFCDKLRVGNVSLSPDGLTATRTSQPLWKRSFGDKIVQRATMQRSTQISFKLHQLGVQPTAEEAGPNFGFAEVGSDRSDDESMERISEGMYTFRARDGMLLAPAAAYIVGPNPRKRAREGDVLTFILHIDGQMSMEVNGESYGIIFQDLPDNMRPVVEMNSRMCKVEIVA
jgi:hypothetical protein